MARNNSWFGRFAKFTSRAAGRPAAFMLGLGIVLLWAASGPLFGYSDTWQLVINTGTTIVTFLMVFLIQATQNRDAEALQLKLDELIRATEGAHNALLDLEDVDEEKMDRIRTRYAELAEAARQARKRGDPDTDSPTVNHDEDDG
jgi:low affinity Fe/Cu permease